MADFTSALYLGFRHPAAALSPWEALTSGVPAALREPEGASEVATGLAELVGMEEALLWPSTLHLFWDLFAVLGRRTRPLLFDEGAYPVARFGAAAAKEWGAPILQFAHFDPEALERALSAARAAAPGIPIVVTDGFCPGCGASAPLQAYADLVERAGGWLVVDDTQAIGIFGEQPCSRVPYGIGGGGSLRHKHVRSERLAWTASLAKGFGVPVAVLSGSRDLVRSVRERGPTRVHTSPPNHAVLAAAAHALTLNNTHGEAQRDRLFERVNQLQKALRSAGFAVGHGAFPAVRVAGLSGSFAVRLYWALRIQKIRSVVSRAVCRAGPELTFLVTATHTEKDVADAASALLGICDKLVERRYRHVDDKRWSSASGAWVSTP